jgi:hypothetical protein
MPTDTPEHVPAPPLRPIISASRGQTLITGRGFLANHPVTVCFMCAAEDVVDCLSYVSGADGCLSAVLPETAITDIGRVNATDHRPDPDGDCGLLWSNTVIITCCDE